MEAGLKGIIRVLVVEDSPVISKVLASILESDPQINVVGVVHNGKEAVEIVPHLKPDIITMDIHMPLMDGVEATKWIMAHHPTPILVVTSSVLRAGMGKVFKAISCGALDVFEKGEVEVGGDKKSNEELIEKIKFLSNIKVIHHPLAKLEIKRNDASVSGVSRKKILDRIVAIVSSTGGPQALLKLLKGLPEEFPCGTVIVQHIADGFVEGLVEWLNSECQVKCKIAEDSEEILAGFVYIAPCGFQMKVEENGKVYLSNEPTHDEHRPSGDVLLNSVAKAYKEGAIGIILTGMGKDGAMGIKAIKDVHGQTIAQDEKSCVVFGMPRVAIEMGVVDKVLPLKEMAEEIVGMLGR